MPRLAQYRQQIATHRCLWCQKPALTERRFCHACLKIHNLSNLLRKRRYNKAGLCRECGQPIPPTSTHVRCDRCYRINADGARRARQRRKFR